MSYRDTTEALRSYRTRIAGELEEARRSAAKLKGLEKELAETDALLRTSDRRRELPMLDGLRIASPCKESWDDMVGDDRVRFCRRCEKNVHNVSSMSREEAEELLRSGTGNLCVRLYRRTDGTVLTSDCPVGARRKRNRRAAVAALAAIGSSVMAALGFGRSEPMMGELRPAVMNTADVRMGDIAPTMGVIAEPKAERGIPATGQVTMGRIPARRP